MSKSRMRSRGARSPVPNPTLHDGARSSLPASRRHSCALPGGVGAVADQDELPGWITSGAGGESAVGPRSSRAGDAGGARGRSAILKTAAAFFAAGHAASCTCAADGDSRSARPGASTARCACVRNTCPCWPTPQGCVGLRRGRGWPDGSPGCAGVLAHPPAPGSTVRACARPRQPLGQTPSTRHRVTTAWLAFSRSTNR